ncbi:TlpA family protein disulfide reductase [Flagellimonas meishanensis]|uniref:TlpA family protein disulfide reductase n=1 Tax=Flagellimonas meishanensis TaxID=2873264 RepID=UPI001CA775EF|nr:TlpA disulfide reductase family protein [[Muricauda] meishanensis]
MKKGILDFAAGIAITLLAISVMLLVTLDLRWITLIISLLILLYTYITPSREFNIILTIFLVCLPIAIFFTIWILPEIPKLWISIPVFISAAFVGRIAGKYKNLALTIPLYVLFSFFIVPSLVESDLSEFVNENPPNIELLSLDTGQNIQAENFRGKVLVLDFFGTWCKPCLNEMKELKKVRDSFKSDSKIEFLMVCTEFGNDTPEKAMEFMKKHDMDFKTYFDFGNASHKSLGFTGVPALLIIDSSGMIRFKHEGYNPSESLDKNLNEIIRSLTE